jgi:hypothetical protein
MAIDFADTYRLGEAFRRGAFRPDVPGYGEMGREELREYHRGQRHPIRPLRLEWAEGSRLMDYTGTTATLPEVVSQRFVDVLRENGVTGWSTFPIELHGKSGELIEGYHGLAVTGRCGPLQLDRSLSMIRPAKSGRGTVEVKVGLFFDASTWDGNDMFVPEDTAFVFVVGKVKRLLEKAKISNVTFTPLDTFERQW